MRIGIFPQGGLQWAGGQQYTANLISALRKYGEDSEVYVISGQEASLNIESLVNTSGSDMHVCSTATLGWLGRQLNHMGRRISGKDIWLSQALDSQSAPPEVVFPGVWRLGRHTAVMGLVYDFQFIHLPEMFGRNGAQRRLSQVLRVVRRCDTVIVSSQAARADFARVAPDHDFKCRVMHFVADVPTSIYEVDPLRVLESYQLPERFFYLPNQLWKHKNHTVVLAALRNLKQRNCRPVVVMTGSTDDPRNPTYAQEFRRDILKAGLQDQVRMLGLVPRQHVYQLIRQSLCVINPSLFEGWSTTVEEAKSVGKRVLISDIPVHQEQNPPLAEYFPAMDAEILAEKLEYIWQAEASGPDFELEVAARAALPGRMAEYAHSFCNFARELWHFARHAFAEWSLATDVIYRSMAT